VPLVLKKLMGANVAKKLKNIMKMIIIIIVLVVSLVFSKSSNSQNAHQVVNRLSNPLAYIGVPFQNTCVINIQLNMRKNGH
jgi:hypothetical protein